MQFEGPSIIVKNERKESLKRFHPWLFSGGIAEIKGNPKPGDCVRVLDTQGEFLALGHYFDSSISVKVLTFEDELIDRAFYTKRLTQALALRNALGLINNQDTNAYRLLHGEGDGLPGLIIDRLGDVAVIDLHSQGYLKDMDIITEVLQTLCEPNLAGIYLNGGEGEGQWLWQGTSGDSITIKENGFKFFVNLAKGQKTGYFLDQRINRKIIQGLARDRTVLDCFSYSGGFAVHALGGGAKSVTCADSSKKALDLATQNLAFNHPSGSFSTIEEDCLKYLHSPDKPYDMIILDPPAFVKHRGALTGGMKGYETINQLAMRHLESGGILATFSCSQLVSTEMFRQMVFKAAMRAQRGVQIIGEFRQSPCHPVSIFHPEGEYLKGLLLYIT